MLVDYTIIVLVVVPVSGTNISGGGFGGFIGSSKGRQMACACAFLLPARKKPRGKCAEKLPTAGFFFLTKPNSEEEKK